MDRLTINIPDGLSDDEKAALAEQLSRIAEQSVPVNGSHDAPSIMDLAGCLHDGRPAGSREEERAAAQQHIVDNYTRENT